MINRTLSLMDFRLRSIISTINQNLFSTVSRYICLMASWKWQGKKKKVCECFQRMPSQKIPSSVISGRLPTWTAWWGSTMVGSTEAAQKIYPYESVESSECSAGSCPFLKALTTNYDFSGCNVASGTSTHRQVLISIKCFCNDYNAFYG